jgi:hypothetical protein
MKSDKGLGSAMSERNKKIAESMKGNTNPQVRGAFSAMLRRKVVQNPERLEKVVDNLLTQAEAGEAWAVKELTDRLDGKAVAAVEMSGPEGNPIETNNTVNFTQEIVQQLLKMRQGK